MPTRPALTLLTATILMGCMPRGAAPATRAAGTGSPARMSASPAVESSDVLTYRGDAARTGAMAGPGLTGPPVIRWTFEAGAPIGSQVAVVATVAYLVSIDGVVHALDLATGKQRWSVAMGVESHASPSVADGLLVIGANDGAHALSLSDGSPVWSSRNPGVVRGSPAVLGHVAVFASDGGAATALDTRTGAVLWTQELGASDDSSVAASGDLALLGLQNGVVVALAIADGSERWRTDTGDAARIGTIAIAGGRVFVATLDGGGPGSRHIASLDLSTGRVLWRFASPGDKPAYVPAVVDGRAIVEGEDGSVTALDPATGVVLWQSKAPGLVEVVAAIANGVTYGASNGGFAFALDVATGAERWRLPIQGVPYGAAVTAGLVLIGTSSGTLYAIGGSIP